MKLLLFQNQRFFALKNLLTKLGIQLLHYFIKIINLINLFALLLTNCKCRQILARIQRLLKASIYNSNGSGFLEYKE